MYKKDFISWKTKDFQNEITNKIIASLKETHFSFFVVVYLHVVNESYKKMCIPQSSKYTCAVFQIHTVTWWRKTIIMFKLLLSLFATAFKMYSKIYFLSWSMIEKSNGIEFTWQIILITQQQTGAFLHKCYCYVNYLDLPCRELFKSVL